MSDFGLCAMSEREANFNLLLCFLLMEEYE